MFKKIVWLIRKVIIIVFDIGSVICASLIYQIYGIEGVSQYLIRLQRPLPILRKFGAEVGKGSIVYPGIVMHAASRDYSNLRIGKDCRIGRECFLDVTEPITVEDTASVGMRNNLITHVNVAKSPLGENELARRSAPITVKRGAVTFAGVTILMGATIGECSAVAAGSVVSNDIPPWKLVGGNPLRFIKSLENTLDSKNKQE